LRGEQLAARVRFIRLVREGMYDLVIGNPPYQGASKMADAKFLAAQYPLSKADLFAVFLERSLQLLRDGGLSAMITMRNWMFIQQFSDLREFFLEQNDLRVLGDVSWGAFSAMKDNPVTMSVIAKSLPGKNHSVAIAPTDLNERIRSAEEIRKKIAGLLCGSERFEFRSDRFRAIKEQPIVYWWDEEFIDRYEATSKLGDETDVRQGMASSDNKRFLRFHWEIESSKTELVKAKHTEVLEPKHNHLLPWVPYTKGSAGKAWIESLDEVIDWSLHGLCVKTLAQKMYQSYTRTINNTPDSFWREKSGR
jgi:Eco57I restriction-modification methylase